MEPNKGNYKETPASSCMNPLRQENLNDHQIKRELKSIRYMHKQNL